MDHIRLFKELTEAFGPPGFEDDVRDILKRYLSAFDLSYDRLGSVIASKTGRGGPRIMVAAHMDEVGFIVKDITKEGYIKFAPIGGWWPLVMLGQRVIVRSRNKDYHGVIGSTPPHILKPEQRKKIPDISDMYIDIGVIEDKGAKELGIRKGDPIIPFTVFTELENNVFAAKAWDNRIGCAVLAGVAERLAKEDFPSTLHLVGTVQEEVGLRGARTSAQLIKPDIAFAVDVSLALDAPKKASEDEKLGGGVAIIVQDNSMIASRRLVEFAQAIAERERIPYHLATVRGGYDTGIIHLVNQGVPSLPLGIPSRYIHSNVSYIKKEDYDATVELLSAMIKDLNNETYKKLIDF